MRSLDRFLSSALRNGDEEAKRRARLLVLVTLLVLLPNVAFISLFLLTGQVGAVPALFITAALVSALVLVRFRSNVLLATHCLCGSYVLVVFHYSFESGGLLTPALWMFSIIAAMLAFLLGGKRTGLLWTSAHVAGISIHIALLAAGIRLPMPAYTGAISMNVVSVVTLTVVLVGIVMAYEGTRERMLAAVQEKTKYARLVLDTIGDGYVLANVDGTMSDERSKALDAVFGVPARDARIWDYVGGTAEERFAFSFGWEALIAGVLPRELLLAQMPTQREISDRTYSLSYRLVTSGDAITGVVVLIRDVSAELVADRANADRVEQAEIFHRVVKDPVGFLAFLREARDLVTTMRTSTGPAFSRALHTLKGNASMVGAMRLASACHALESRIAEGAAATPLLIAKLANDVEALATFFEPLVRERSVVLAAFEKDMVAIRHATSGFPCERKVTEIASRWTPSSVERNLTRLAEKTRFLAQRLGKGDVGVHVEADAIELPEAALAPLWPALVHLVRNAIDHGIEPAAERVDAHKSGAGTITLAAALVGDNVEISVRDDGGGIDWNAVRARAQSRGLRADTSDDLTHALFADGFTTSESVTTESGRGVGMGAVMEAAMKLGGQIQVTSERGAGTNVVVRFPRPRVASNSSRAA